jgi:N-acyl-D-aspartate/D-glutamate deacylase
MLDVLIKGATVVDGTGSARYAGDVGVRAGRIVALGPAGSVTEAARQTVDATGMVVAPGFVDIHTHYDAQLFWDPALSPSSLHGVTTAIGGNCGFTIAPIADEHADYLMRMLARVEGMPLESLAQGVPWGEWRTFGEWLDRIEGTMAVNTGFLAGHSAIRRVVLGDDMHEPAPSEAQLTAMEDQLRAALAAGALGFSSSNGIVHVDGDGEPVPSRAAGDDEIVRLSRVVSEFPGATALEYIPPGAADEADRMIAMSLAANRPLNWNILIVTSERQALVDGELSASDQAAAAGARVIALVNPGPMQSRRSFFTGFVLDVIPDWKPILELPLDERMAALRRPDVRAKLLEGTLKAEPRFKEIVDFAHYVIEDTVAPENEGTRDRMVADIAAERGVKPLDALLDIVLADGLRTTLLQPEWGGDAASWELRSKLWRDPRIVLGASDAGAHLDTLSTFFYTTDLLGPSVRDQQRMGLEEAVRLITDVPARLYGLRDRGRIAEGWCADLVVFDPATIGHGRVHTRNDLPGGAGRLYAEATGISHVFVNGVEILRDGAYTGSTPGSLIRGGRDTDPVTL